MPVHVEEMTSEVTVVAGDLPLTEAQTEKLVKLVLRRLEQKQREAGRVREATQLRRGVTPPEPIQE
jgi:hypothetical protein